MKLEHQQLAQFALTELSKLSDSNIYSTLQLSKIISVEEDEGIYHFNTIFVLELASPYFKSGLEKENVTMVVMSHKEDHTKSIAIDEFPIMDDEAIEKFYIMKIEKKRQSRDEAFIRMQAEYIALHMLAHSNRQEDEESPDISTLSTRSLLKYIDDRMDKQDQSYMSETRIGSLSGQYLEEELQLLMASLPELFDIIMGNGPTASEYQHYRARFLLDDRLELLQY